jgi:catechol 2,3-dioxygenase-like lactoylglutathione lyase family enzyme
MTRALFHSLDHAVIAVRDLAAATEGYAALLGRPPSWRGVHPGVGTANALFRLENTYLELLAPEGEGALGRRLADGLAEQGEGLVALAFGTDDAELCVQRLRAAGLSASDPREGEGRDVESGARRRWRNVLLAPDATRGLWLFAIEHLDAADSLALRELAAAPEAAVSALDHVVVASTDLEASRSLYGAGLGLRLALDRSFEARGLRMVFFRVGGVTVEVVGQLKRVPGEPGAAPEPSTRDRFGGLAWRVPDAQAARERLAAAGFDISEVRPGAKPGTRVCTVRRETWGVPTLLISSDA